MAKRDGVAFFRGNIHAATDEEPSGLSGRRLHLDCEPRGRDLLEDLGVAPRSIRKSGEDIRAPRNLLPEGISPIELR
jgi:hypothetical protein